MRCIRHGGDFATARPACGLETRCPGKTPAPLPLRARQVTLAVVFFFILILTMTQSQAQPMPQTPAPGSAMRSQILAAARTPTVEALGKEVVFQVKHLSVLDGWAFLQSTLQQPGGAPLDYSGTPFAEAAEHGVVSDVYVALLQQEGGGWQVRAEALGPTDLAWAGWDAQYGAPAAIFPPEARSGHKP